MRKNYVNILQPDLLLSVSYFTLFLELNQGIFGIIFFFVKPAQKILCKPK